MAMTPALTTTHHKYRQVAAALRAQLQGGGYRAGDRLPGEQVLAERYAVNHLTMRKALEVLAAEGRVVKRARSGTFVAEPEAPNGVRSVLYVGPIGAHGYDALAAALAREAQSHSLALSAFNPTAEADLATAQRKFRQLLLPGQGLVAAVAALPFLASLDLPVRPPLVVADIHATEETLHHLPWPAPVVAADWGAAARIATAELLALGHRRIAMLDAIDNAPNGLTGSPSPTRNTAVAYQAALAVRQAPPMLVGHHFDRPASMDAALDWMLEHYGEWPTAFVCVGDFRAGPLIRALLLRGRHVPEQISLVGIGDTPWCEWVSPPLTSVNLGQVALARLALLLLRQPEPPAASFHRVAPHFVPRQTTAPRHAQPASAR